MGLPNMQSIREARGLSRKELGEKVSKSEQAIYYYETGRRSPDVDTLRAIAKALECSVGDLFSLAGKVAS